MIGTVASLASGAAFVVSVLLAWSLAAGGGEAVSVPFAQWIHIGSSRTSIGRSASNSLSTTMMLVVSGVGTLIHIYAIGYMHEDVRFKNDVGRFQPLLRFSQPVHRLHDDSRQRRLVPDALRRLGRCGTLLLPIDRLLV